jgi:hypothetical protein
MEVRRTFANPCPLWVQPCDLFKPYLRWGARLSHLSTKLARLGRLSCTPLRLTDLVVINHALGATGLDVV